MSEGAVNTWPWSIHERIKALGGSLKVESSVARGARLRLEIPVPRQLGTRQQPK